jgi:hypothetical protein
MSMNLNLLNNPESGPSRKRARSEDSQESAHDRGKRARSDDSNDSIYNDNPGEFENIIDRDYFYEGESQKDLDMDNANPRLRRIAQLAVDKYKASSTEESQRLDDNQTEECYSLCNDLQIDSVNLKSKLTATLRVTYDNLFQKNEILNEFNRCNPDDMPERIVNTIHSDIRPDVVNGSHDVSMLNDAIHNGLKNVEEFKPHSIKSSLLNALLAREEGYDKNVHELLPYSSEFRTFVHEHPENFSWVIRQSASRVGSPSSEGSSILASIETRNSPIFRAISDSRANSPSSINTSSSENNGLPRWNPSPIESNRIPAFEIFEGIFIYIHCIFLVLKLICILLFMSYFYCPIVFTLVTRFKNVFKKH